MPQHITRKELKKDEFRETLAHSAEAVLSHRQMVFAVLGGVLVVALAILGWRLYADRQAVKASAAFDDAMKVFQARVRGPGEPSEPGEVTYVDAKNKFGDAAKRFSAIASQYPRTRPGQLADYYAALSLERLDRYDEARRRLEALASHGSSDYAPLARFELAQLEERTGRGDDAVRIYNELMAHPVDLVPKPTVMFALAEHYRQSNPAEAAKLFNQIKSEYQDSALAQQADEQLALLAAKP